MASGRDSIGAVSHARRRQPISAGAGALAAAALAVAAAWLPGACTFSPDIESGKLTCSPKGECPRGFTCAPSGLYANRCVTEGTPIVPAGTGGTAGSSGFPDGGVGRDATADAHFEAPPDLVVPGSGGAGGTGLPGLGGTGVPVTTTTPFMGTWEFDPGSYTEVDCGAGTTPMQYDIAQSKVSVYSSALGATYAGASWSVWSACTYQLALGTDGALHLYDSNWQCNDTSAVDPTYTWFGYDFDFYLTSATARTASHYGTYIIGQYYADGEMYFCNEYVTGTLTKL
jgi:hypothetical protein